MWQKHTIWVQLMQDRALTQAMKESSVYKEEKTTVYNRETSQKSKVGW